MCVCVSVSVSVSATPAASSSAYKNQDPKKDEMMHFFLTEDEKEPDLVQMCSKYFLGFFRLRFWPYKTVHGAAAWPCTVSSKIVSRLT